MKSRFDATVMAGWGLQALAGLDVDKAETYAEMLPAMVSSFEIDVQHLEKFTRAVNTISNPIHLLSDPISNPINPIPERINPISNQAPVQPFKRYLQLKPISNLNP